MKKLLLLVAVATLFGFVSCKKKSNSPAAAEFTPEGNWYASKITANSDFLAILRLRNAKNGEEVVKKFQDSINKFEGKDIIKLLPGGFVSRLDKKEDGTIAFKTDLKNDRWFYSKPDLILATRENENADWEYNPYLIKIEEKTFIFEYKIKGIKAFSILLKKR